MTVSLELADLQGLAVRGYGRLRAACLLLLRIDETQAGRADLARLVPEVTSASSSPTTSALNIAHLARIAPAGPGTRRCARRIRGVVRVRDGRSGPEPFPR